MNKVKGTNEMGGEGGGVGAVLHASALLRVVHYVMVHCDYTVPIEKDIFLILTSVQCYL